MHRREVYEALLKQAKRRTEIADAVLDEEGKIVGFADGNGRLDNDDGVIIVGPDDEPPLPTGNSKNTNATPATKAASKAARPKTKRTVNKKPASTPRTKAPAKKATKTRKPRMRLNPEGGLFAVASEERA